MLMPLPLRWPQSQSFGVSNNGVSVVSEGSGISSSLPYLGPNCKTAGQWVMFMFLDTQLVTQRCARGHVPGWDATDDW